MAHGFIDRAACLDILNKELLGRLGLVDGDRPYVVPVSFVYYRDKIYFHSNPRGRKLEIMARNANACLQVDSEVTLVSRNTACTLTWHYYSVHVFGEARLVEDEARRLEVMRALVKRYPVSHEMPLLDEKMMAAAPFAVVEMDISEISGVEHARLAKQ